MLPLSQWPYRWRAKTRLKQYFGAPCRVLIFSRKMNSALVEFPDGKMVVTSRNYIRRRRPK